MVDIASYLKCYYFRACEGVLAPLQSPQLAKKTSAAIFKVQRKRGEIVAVKLEFYISEEDMERLWAIKEAQGRNDLTGNEFDRELLESVLCQLHPDKVENEDE